MTWQVDSYKLTPLQYITAITRRRARSEGIRGSARPLGQWRHLQDRGAGSRSHSRRAMAGRE